MFKDAPAKAVQSIYGVYTCFETKQIFGRLIEASEKCENKNGAEACKRRKSDRRAVSWRRRASRGRLAANLRNEFVDSTHKQLARLLQARRLSSVGYKKAAACSSARASKTLHQPEYMSETWPAPAVRCVVMPIELSFL